MDWVVRTLPTTCSLFVPLPPATLMLKNKKRMRGLDSILILPSLDKLLFTDKSFYIALTELYVSISFIYKMDIYTHIYFEISKVDCVGFPVDFLPLVDLSWTKGQTLRQDLLQKVRFCAMTALWLQRLIRGSALLFRSALTQRKGLAQTPGCRVGVGYDWWTSVEDCSSVFLNSLNNPIHGPWIAWLGFFPEPVTTPNRWSGVLDKGPTSLYSSLSLSHKDDSVFFHESSHLSCFFGPT